MTHSSRPMRVIGRVHALYRYPVKSMAAEPLEGVDVGWHGLAGDRRWAFIRDGSVQSGFPWLTIRQHGALWHYRPELVDAADPDKSPTLVHTPAGATLDVADPALAGELGPGVRVIRQKTGIFDTAPLSLITTQTITSLGGALDTTFEPRRFRPNIVIDAASGGSAPESDWIGATLCIGTLRMRVDQPDERCAIITVDPNTLERDPRVLRTVVQDRRGELGVYGSTVRPGRIAVGDTVSLEPDPS